MSPTPYFADLQRDQNFIDGQWRQSVSGLRHEVIDPATGSAFSDVPDSGARDAIMATTAAHAAFDDWRLVPARERARLLKRWHALIIANADGLATIISREQGKPFAESRSEVAYGASYIEWFSEEAVRTYGDIIPEQVPGRKMTVTKEPVGVVAAITPWNFPLAMIARKIAPALAAGCTIVLKPSELSPLSALLFAEVVHDAGVPAGVFNLVNGDGPGVGAAISSHKHVDMVSFTGSTRAGIAVAQAAAPTVKRVHQELGGKAPNLVLKGANLPEVLPPTVQGVLANSGQSCIAPTRLLVHESQVADATNVVKAIMEATPVAEASTMGAHIGPVVNKAQYEKIQGLIQSAIDEGATLVTGGTGRPDGRNAGFFVKPTLLADVTPDMRIYREETFGPVATITKYSDADEAIEMANDTVYGLSATISGDPAEAAKVAPKLRAGLVTINAWSGGSGTPFGGYKQSGNGREGGKYGIADFMELKTIVGEPA